MSINFSNTQAYLNSLEADRIKSERKLEKLNNEQREFEKRNVRLATAGAVIMAIMSIAVFMAGM
jgi:uncharacterized membrane protein (DUF106 family)